MLTKETETKYFEFELKKVELEDCQKPLLMMAVRDITSLLQS